MEWLLRRNFWMVRLLGLVIITGLVANTTTTLLALYLLSSRSEIPTRVDDEEEADEDETALAGARHRTDERAYRAERTAERILGYNPMCPTCGPTPTDEVVTDDPDVPLDPSTAELAGAKRSTLPIAVAVTMESPDPSLSVATLVDVERGVGGLFGVGDQPLPGVEVVRINSGVVHIVNDGRFEYIQFRGEPMPDPVPKSTKPEPKRSKKTTSRAIPGAEEAIQCEDNGSCVVDRAFVESLIAQPKLLVGQGAASPATTKDGSPGFKLRRVRKGTLPDLLGLESGDVITEVSGNALTLDALPGLLGKLRHASHLEVMVDRRGKTMRRQLEIRS